VPLAVEVTCPACNSVQSEKIDPVPGAQKDTVCSNCSIPLHLVSEADNVLAVKQDGARQLALISEELLQRVKEAMGPQPCPKGRAAHAADVLGLSRDTIQLAIGEHIRRGNFQVQVDGKLYPSNG
jgi:hypothetical protein